MVPKFLRNNREHHSRKGSLQASLEDVFLRQTHISDPKILKIIENSRPEHEHKPISPEVLALLVESDESHSDSNDSNMQVD